MAVFHDSFKIKFNLHEDMHALFNVFNVLAKVSDNICKTDTPILLLPLLLTKSRSHYSLKFALSRL